jgi:hypothetical protein
MSSHQAQQAAIHSAHRILLLPEIEKVACDLVNSSSSKLKFRASQSNLCVDRGIYSGILSFIKQ